MEESLRFILHCVGGLGLAKIGRCVELLARGLFAARTHHFTFIFLSPVFIFFYCAGLILAGTATILTLLLAARWLHPPLDRFVTQGLVDLMAKVILLTGMIVGYAYAMELFIAFYGANKFELFTFFNARLGVGGMRLYHLSYYAVLSGSVFAPQVFWFKQMRANYVAVFVVCCLVNLSTWMERLVVFVTSRAGG